MSKDEHIVQPLTAQRIAKILQEMELQYEIDDDGVYEVPFEDGSIYIFCKGEHQEILNCRGVWKKCLSQTVLLDVYRWINDRHCEYIFPKCYTFDIDDDRKIGIATEIAMDYEPGITDRQLRFHLDMAISVSLSIFEELAQESFALDSSEEWQSYYLLQ